jgi:hypothetical protein
VLDAVIAFHERQVKIAEGVLAAEGNLYSADARSRAQIEVATHSAFLETLRAAQRDLVDAHPQWRHLKRGSIYSEVGVVTLQAEQPVVDDDRPGALSRRRRCVVRAPAGRVPRRSVRTDRCR